MAPDGEINTGHPLWPRVPGEQTEWGNNDPLPGPGGCDQSPNSRTGTAHRWQTDSSGNPVQLAGWPFAHTYDAAGNLRNDGRHYFQYDGANRFKDVYLVDLTNPNVPARGYILAHYDYNGLGQLIKSTYNTDGDNSLDDEDVEWTPRDPLGRPIGIWRQGPLSGGARPCSKPYPVCSGAQRMNTGS